MATMFINHQPVQLRTKPTVLNRLNDELQFNVDGEHLEDVIYVCFVHKGICYAARHREVFNSGMRVAYRCTPMDDQPCVQEMLLADMILN